jgi:hypothetical protein
VTDAAGTRQTVWSCRNIVAATEALSALRQRLASPKARRRSAAEIDLQVAQILEHYHVSRYLKVRRSVRGEPRYKQSKRGLLAQHFLPGVGPKRDAVGAGARLQRCERTVGVDLAQVARALFFDQIALACQALHDARDDALEQVLQLLVAGGAHLMQQRLAGAAPINAIEHTIGRLAPYGRSNGAKPAPRRRGHRSNSLWVNLRALIRRGRGYRDHAYLILKARKEGLGGQARVMAF